MLIWNAMFHIKIVCGYICQYTYVASWRICSVQKIPGMNLRTELVNKFIVLRMQYNTRHLEEIWKFSTIISNISLPVKGFASPRFMINLKRDNSISGIPILIWWHSCIETCVLFLWWICIVFQFDHAVSTSIYIIWHVKIYKVIYEVEFIYSINSFWGCKHYAVHMWFSARLK